MANANDWREILAKRGWINDEGVLGTTGDALIRILLPEGRNFVIRPGKTSPQVQIVGEFLACKEYNVDSAGHERMTIVAITHVESIDALS